MTTGHYSTVVEDLIRYHRALTLQQARTRLRNLEAIWSDAQQNPTDNDVETLAMVNLAYHDLRSQLVEFLQDYDGPNE